MDDKKHQILRISKQGDKLLIILPKDSGFQHKQQVLISDIDINKLLVAE